ncbi:hypothetical protein BDZ91DRAFT_798005 [Kalaharituber pfeilii]|nr:hypothetical protein BDZ91DRAFT_798005 [Kalaharituber pfeilii]
MSSPETLRALNFQAVWRDIGYEDGDGNVEYIRCTIVLFNFNFVEWRDIPTTLTSIERTLSRTSTLKLTPTLVMCYEYTVYGTVYMMMPCIDPPSGIRLPIPLPRGATRYVHDLHCLRRRPPPPNATGWARYMVNPEDAVPRPPSPGDEGDNDMSGDGDSLNSSAPPPPPPPPPAVEGVRMQRQLTPEEEPMTATIVPSLPVSHTLTHSHPETLNSTANTGQLATRPQPVSGASTRTNPEEVQVSHASESDDEEQSHDSIASVTPKGTKKGDSEGH